jgi:hypothetical protein
MDRLLSKQELELLDATEESEIDDSDESTCETCQRLTCEAQDIKTSKWWIEKVEYQRDNICCVEQETTLCPLADPCCSFMKESCDWWQNLKKEMLND